MARREHGETYSARVWRRLRRHRSGFVGLIIVVTLMLTALLAPLIANDRPIVAQYKGDWVFPAFTTYVDTWIPWRSVANDLKSWEWGEGSFPFSDHYAALEGKTWLDVKGTPELSHDLWPLVEHSPTQFDAGNIKKKPGEDPNNLLGTDDQGRSVLARLIHGTVVAMLVGLVSQTIAVTVGVSLGLAAGYFGGWVDLVISRVAEVVMCFPTFFLIIAVIAFLEPSIVNIMAVIGGVSWTQIFRLIRGEVLKVRGLEYVTAARALGVPSRRIMFRHVLPNAISPVFVAAAFGVASAVLTETSLSFLGFGDPSAPSWGEIVLQGRAYVAQGLWHLTVFPGLAIFVTLTAFNLLGQGLRDAMDPKLRE
jgi:peptide/nickel transport system permease protein